MPNTTPEHAAELLALPCPMPAAAEHEEMLARIYDEGAAAGVAASEARVRELETVARDLAALISHEDDGIGREWYELTAGWRETERALSALAALLSEEPGAG